MMNTITCGYCGSTDVASDSSGKYDFEGKEYEFSVYICDDKDTGCGHSWTLDSDKSMPEAGKIELLAYLDEVENQK